MKATKTSVDTYDILTTTTLGAIRMSALLINDELGRMVCALAIESLEKSLELNKLLWERIEELEAQANPAGQGPTPGSPMEDHPDSQSAPDEDPRQ